MTKKKKNELTKIKEKKSGFPLWIVVSVIGIVAIAVLFLLLDLKWLAITITVVGFLIVILIDWKNNKSGYQDRVPLLLTSFIAIIAFSFYPDSKEASRIDEFARSGASFMEGAGAPVDHESSLSIYSTPVNESPISVSEEKQDNPENQRFYELADKFRASKDTRTLEILAKEIIGYKPWDAKSALYVGTAYFDLGEYAKAIENLELALSFDDINDVAYPVNYNLCISYLFAGKNNEAAVYCDRAMDSKEGLNNQITLYCIKANCYDDYERKKTYHRKALTIPPQNAKDYFFRGLIFDDGFWEIANRDSAIVNLSKAIDLDPTDDRFFYHRGKIYYESFRSELALDDYKQSLSIDSTNVKYLFGAGMACFALGKYVDANSFFTQANLLDTLSDARFMRGVSNLVCGDEASAEESLRDFDYLIDHGIEYADLHLFRSVARRITSEFYENYEIEYFDDIDLLGSSNFPKWWRLCNTSIMYQIIELYRPFMLELGIGVGDASRCGKAYYYLGDYRKAMKCYNAALKNCWYGLGLGDSDEEEERIAAALYYNRSVVENRLPCRKWKAIRDVSKAIKLDPDVPRYYYWRSIIYGSKRRYKRKRDDLIKAIQLDSTQVEYYRELGKCYFYDSDYRNALLNYQKAYQLDSTDKETLSDIVLCKMEMTHSEWPKSPEVGNLPVIDLDWIHDPVSGPK